MADTKSSVWRIYVRFVKRALRFARHTDGSIQDFTPESVVQIQESLGSDIMMALDECPPHTASREQAQDSADCTCRWAKRAKEAWKSDRGVLFGICQGAMYVDLRKISSGQLAEQNFPGYAIGGLGVGEEKTVTYEMLTASISQLPVRSAALSYGHRSARGSCERRRTGRGYVRLCSADARSSKWRTLDL